MYWALCHWLMNFARGWGLDVELVDMTDMDVLKRAMRPEEAGKMAAALLSDLSSGVTGQTVYVDMGYNITGL